MIRDCLSILAEVAAFTIVTASLITLVFLANIIVWP